jgi:hypothetical protein
MTSISRCSIGGVENWYLNGSISRILVFPRQLSDTEVAEISSRMLHSSTDYLYDFPTPSIDSSGNIHLVYNKQGSTGIGERTFNNTTSTWSSPSTALSSISNQKYQNTLSVGDDLYYFYTSTSDNKRYMAKKVSGTWISPVAISSFTTLHTNEIIDQDNTIHIFATDNDPTYKTLKTRTYTPSTNTWTDWISIDSQTNTNVQYPSATLDSQGNIYLYYNIGNDIYYKIHAKTTDT